MNWKITSLLPKMYLQVFKLSSVVNMYWNSKMYKHKLRTYVVPPYAHNGTWLTYRRAIILDYWHFILTIRVVRAPAACLLLLLIRTATTITMRMRVSIARCCAQLRHAVRIGIITATAAVRIAIRRFRRCITAHGALRHAQQYVGRIPWRGLSEAMMIHAILFDFLTLQLFQLVE